MERSSSGEALVTWSDEYSAAAASVRIDGWLGNLLVGGGDVSCGVGGVGVRTAARLFNTWAEGGGVMDDDVRGAGDLKPARSGDASFDILAAAADSDREAERKSGVSGRAASVVCINKSCDGWYRGAWLSMVPKAQAVQAVRNTSDNAGCAGCSPSRSQPVSLGVRADGVFGGVGAAGGWSRTRGGEDRRSRTKTTGLSRGARALRVLA